MAVDSRTLATAAALLIGVGVAVALLNNRPGVKVPDSYSYIVPNTENPSKGLGAIYRNPKSKEKLVTCMPDGAATSYESFQRGVQKGGSRPCFGRRPIIGKNAKGEPLAGDYAWQTYDEVNQRMANFAAGLVHFDLLPQLPGAPETGPIRLLGLYLKNRPEWVIAEQACFRQGAATVPMYDTLGPDTVEMIFNETELAAVVAAPGAIKTLCDAQPKCPSFKAVVYVDELSADDIERLKSRGLQVLSFAEVETAGAAHPVAAQPPSPGDIATFCYTSGTTGKSKGALLTHTNMVSVTASVEALGISISSDDRHLSYLPLAHVFERACMLLLLNAGARIGFSQGDPARIVDDIAVLRPTFFPSVPRLLNRVHDKVMAGVEQQGGLKARMFRAAYAAKQQGLRNGHLKHRVWDAVIFKKLAKRLGLDECRVCVTGSAPIAPHVIDFFRIVLGCTVVEGYGQTETSAATCVQHPEDFTSGNVGYPLACNEVRLVSVPDMGYSVADRVHGADERTGSRGVPCMGRGEICSRGPNAFKGYFKMPQNTAEALDEEGWVHSGDIGIWTPLGQLKIVDRKKNIFKLAQGEYIAPEKIENIYAKSSAVMQSFVYGDSFQHQLVGIIVPDPDGCPKFCADHNLPVAPVGELCKSAEFKKALMAELDRLRKEAKLFTFEHVADVFLDPTPFSMENDLLTPTFKLKRDVAKKHYQQHIDQMYHDLGGVAGVQGLKQ